MTRVNPRGAAEAWFCAWPLRHMPVHSLGQWRTGAIRRDIKRPGPGGLTEAIASAARRACAGARACAQAPSVMLALTGARGPLELFVGQGPCGHGWRRGQAQARDARAAAGPLGGPGLLLAEDRRPWYLASAGRLGHADPQRRAPTGSHSLSAPEGRATARRGRIYVTLRQVSEVLSMGSAWKTL